VNKEELLKKFEKNVDYLKRTIPPDDIYLFAEQTFMAALFFMHKWAEWDDMEDAMKTDPVTYKWIMNILGFQAMKDQNMDIQLDLGLDELDEK
jgi:hypothetical protein